MNIDAFDRGKTVTRLVIPDPHDGKPLELPVLIAKGTSPGPTLAVLAAVHGDEFEGVLAVQDAFLQLDTERMSGTLIALPVTNLPAYQACSRSTPEDGKNLARVFPGDPEGTVTERIAFHVAENVIRRADFLLDLHSSGRDLTSPTLVGYLAEPGPVGELATAAANAFGAPVVWEHHESSPGRTLSVAREAGIPALYTEANGGLRVRDEDLAIYTQGIRNVMGVLGMLEEQPTSPPRIRIGGGGNTDTMTAFEHGGLFRPHVKVLERVQEGDVIGEVRDLEGNLLESVLAPRQGRVAFLRAVPSVSPGDAAVLIASELA